MRLTHQSRKKYTKMDTMLFHGKGNTKQISKERGGRGTNSSSGKQYRVTYLWTLKSKYNLHLHPPAESLKFSEQRKPDPRRQLCGPLTGFSPVNELHGLQIKALSGLPILNHVETNSCACLSVSR